MSSQSCHYYGRYEQLERDNLSTKQRALAFATFMCISDDHQITVFIQRNKATHLSLYNETRERKRPTKMGKIYQPKKKLIL